MFISDIHGDYEMALKAIELFEKTRSDQLIILGDICHNGIFYNKGAKSILSLFTHLAPKLILVRGNCDRKNDEEYAPVKFLDEYQFQVASRLVSCNHGHQGRPKASYKPLDIIVQGHTHIGMVKEQQGLILANPGSVSNPRGGSKSSFLIIDEKGIFLYDFNNQPIDQYLFEVK